MNAPEDVVEEAVRGEMVLNGTGCGFRAEEDDGLGPYDRYTAVDQTVFNNSDLMRRESQPLHRTGRHDVGKFTCEIRQSAVSHYSRLRSGGTSASQ